jgi:hypothetical protein
LWRCPIARSGIKIGVDRAGLNIVDRDTAVANFSGQPLSEHLYGTLGSGVCSQSGCVITFADTGADRDDTAVLIKVLQRRLRCDEDRTNVEIKNVIELFNGCLFKGLRDRRAGIVDQYI